MTSARSTIVRAGIVAVGAGLAAGLLAAPPATAATSTGPRLTVPTSTMNHALSCTGNLRSGKQAPVLFLHGTTSTSKANWSWNWVRAMDAAKRPHCELDSPNGATGDIQVSAEYVVNAIRVMNRAAGRRISIVGHSQGGMVGRWALKYWPDTRAMVDDYVGLASSNHGSSSGVALCVLQRGCSAANWQQSTGSHFLTALNSGPETWPGISYTVVATRYDEIVAPPTAGFLRAGPNVTNTTVQDICPLEIVEHFGMAYDNAAWLVGIDALTHAGPATVSRVPRRCGIPTMPSVNLATFAVDVASALAVTVQNTSSAKTLPAEPALRSYAR
ncbi:alpha/beta fold hydrolase [Aeromicrobium sp.]|uniref:esterase/lipase family protein n=1 Tax=Aeromicrobium sp. TaxID=1871063 RepID=UPI001990489E|nr:alpha/beta fold hydrolase [Aeromicrobium sp.]MBC7631365.1 alpha/beta fold hydrolase [Aeromicrobium sp.]